MSRAFELYVPCTSVSVEVRLDSGAGLTPLEQLFLQAVHAGVSSFAELVDMFSLGPRITLDLVFDLWRQGHLVVDTFRGVVALSAETAEKVRKGRLEDLDESAAREEARELMQEQLTGHLMSTRHHRRASLTERTRVPVHNADVAFDDLSDADVTAALVDDFRREWNGGERGELRRIVSARISERERLVSRTQRLLPILVRTVYDEEADDLRVEVLAESVLPRSVCGEMARRLEALAETDPLSAFVEHLKSQSSLTSDAPRAPSAARRLERLHERVEGLLHVDPSLWPDHHEDLLALAGAAEEPIVAARDANVDVAVLATRADLDAALREMIGAAEQQIVIASTWIGDARLHSLFDHLEGALGRGVQVFLLWGIGLEGQVQAKGLHADVQRRLQMLETRHPHRLFVSRRSSGTHAKFVLQDDRRALLTSANLLSGVAGAAPFELGLSIAARPDALRCRPLERLLRWARDHYPEYTSSRLIYHLSEDFVQDAEALRGADAARVGPERPSPPPATGEAAAEASGALWIRAWEAFASELGQAVAAAGDRTLRLVTDGQHRALLEDALGPEQSPLAVQHRLILTSDQLSSDVLDTRRLALLEACLQRGVAVALIWQRVRESEASLIEELERLAARHPQLSLAQTRSHAKVLIVDDVVTVTSFNFLSFAGFYETGQGGVRRRQRTELGMQIRDVDLANEVVAAVWSLVPGDPPVPRLRGPDEPPATAPAAFAGAVNVESVEAARAALASGEDLAQVVETTPQAGAFLDALAEADLPISELRAAAAMALLRDRLDPADRARWFDRLVRDCIETGDLLAAAILRTGCAEPADLPDARALILAECIGKAGFERALQDVMELPDGDAEWTAVAALAAVQLAIAGDPNADVVVELGRETAGPAWAATIDAIRTFWTTWYRALPLHELRTQSASLAATADLEASWSRLAAALDAAETKRSVDWVEATRDHVHGPGEMFGELRQFANARNHRAVIRWYSTYGRTNLGHLIDDAARKVTDGKNRLHKNTREGYLTLLRTIVREARKLAAIEQQEAEGIDPATLGDAAAALVRVQEQREARERETAAMPPAVALGLTLAGRRFDEMSGVT